MLAKVCSAAVNGIAIGGGCNLALMCDLVLMREDATIGQTYVQRGLVLDMGGTITAIHPDAQSPNMVLGLKDAGAYEASGWWNCLIGRYANRIRGGFTLDGKHYPLVQN